MLGQEDRYAVALARDGFGVDERPATLRVP